MLGTAEESTDRSRIQPQICGNFGVVETLRSQEEQLRVLSLDPPQDGAYLFGLLIGGTQILGSGHAAETPEQRLVPGAPGSSAKLIQAGSDCRAHQPRLKVIRLHTLTCSQPEENFNGEFFGARGVANDAGNETGDVGVMGAEEKVEIERSLLRGEVRECFALCGHTLTTPAAPIL
jgi:hypothetical protein